MILKILKKRFPFLGLKGLSKQIGVIRAIVKIIKKQKRK
jgi:hypothetical protein